MNEAVIHVSHLTKTFHDFWHRPVTNAVTDLSFSVRRGEVFGLLGPNGAGKSTTIRSIMGLQHPSSGNVRVFGMKPASKLVRRRTGYMPEESYLPQALSCREVLQWFATLNELDSRTAKQRIQQLLHMLEMTEAADKPLHECSKGMQRRICLAQALVHDPELLILDEPTSGLDPIGCRQIKELIRLLADSGKTVLICSHLLADIQFVADHIAILQKGRKLVEGRVSELLADKHAVILSTDSALSEEQQNQTLQWIQTHIEPSARLNPGTCSLEDYFIQILNPDTDPSESSPLFPPPASYLCSPRPQV